MFNYEQDEGFECDVPNCDDYTGNVTNREPYLYNY